MWSGIKRSNKHLGLKLRLTQHSLNSFPAQLLLCLLNFMEAYGKLVIINVKCLSRNLNGLFGSLLKWNIFSLIIGSLLSVIFFPLTVTSLMLTSSPVQKKFLTPSWVEIEIQGHSMSTQSEVPGYFFFFNFDYCDLMSCERNT